MVHKPIKIGIRVGNGPVVRMLLPYLSPPVLDIVYRTEQGAGGVMNSSSEKFTFHSI